MSALRKIKWEAADEHGGSQLQTGLSNGSLTEILPTVNIKIKHREEKPTVAESLDSVLKYAAEEDNL